MFFDVVTSKSWNNVTKTSSVTFISFYSKNYYYNGSAHNICIQKSLKTFKKNLKKTPRYN